VRERELGRRRQLGLLEPANLGEIVRGAGIAVRTRPPRQTEDDPAVVRLEPVAEKVETVELETRLLTHLAVQTVQGQLVLVQKAARKVPQPLAGIERTPAEQDAAVRIEAHGLDRGHRVRVSDEAAGLALHAVVALVDSLAADGTEAPSVQSTHGKHHMSPRAVGATQSELSRIGLLATLPGETLARLAQNMTREDLPAGAGVIAEGDEGDRFYVVLGGMLYVTQQSRGTQAVLRPGDYFGEVALAMHMPRTASVRALTPATVASCDQETFDHYIRPLFADDEG
jgi:hypothetical protein